MFELVVLMTVTDPDEVGMVADALTRMRPICLAEPGCVRWEALHAQDDPQRFVLVETWTSKEAWEAHGELSAIQTIYLPEILPRVTREVHPSLNLGYSG